MNFSNKIGLIFVCVFSAVFQPPVVSTELHFRQFLSESQEESFRLKGIENCCFELVEDIPFSEIADYLIQQFAIPDYYNVSLVKRDISLYDTRSWYCFLKHKENESFLTLEIAVLKKSILEYS